jgi:NAD(P)-dependent dehydrogenase (short-subunit alcohol dehydrogenase family)
MIDIDLKNKIVLITGGCSGAGKTIAEQFLKTGATVLVTYNKTLPENEKVKAYKYDQEDLDSIKKLVEEVINDYGRIDVLVNNAGIYPARSLDTMNEEDYDAMFDINTKGVFFLSKEFAKHMNNGSIINISSINATNPASKLIHYGMSKAAIEMETRCLAYELGPNIRVNCIAPGLIYREGMEEYIPKWCESYRERSALKRMVYPEDIGNTAIFLASDISSAITGQIITVDCGVSLAPYFYNEIEDEYD